MTVRRPARPAARPSARAAARLALPLTAAVLALTGCSAAQEAVAGATDAASAKASEAVDGAKDKASAKASELAVKAAKDQMCALVEDGRLSGADATALDGLVSAGEAAGVPKDVLSLARAVAEAGTDATSGQVSDLKAKACG